MKRSFGPRKTANLSASINQQLNGYALAAGAAGVGLLALAPLAEAKIIYTPAHAKVGSHPVDMDLNHDGIVDFHLNIYGRYSSSFLSACQYLRGSFCSFSRGTNAIRVKDFNGAYWGAALRYGAKIQRGDRFYTGNVRLGRVGTAGGSNTSWAGPWFNGGEGVKDRYLGLKFKIKGRLHFGWARMTVTITKNSFTATLTGYAYETIPGKGIVAGRTKGADDGERSDATPVAPTPGLPTLGALAMGAPGLSIWRRKELVVPGN